MSEDQNIEFKESWRDEYFKENIRITNKVYQEINKTSSRTAVRDLKLLVNKGIIRQKGLKKGALYEFSLGVNGAKME